jgi:hypothetical protein
MITGRGPFKSTGFSDSLRLYLRVLVCVLAVIGLGLVVGLQAGWVDVVWSPEQPLDVDSLAPDAATQEATLEAIGSKRLFSKDMIAVDPGKTYRLDADIRVLPGADGSTQTSTVYFGVSTYDASGKELKSGPGSYRYAGALNRNVSSEENWVHIGGTITGEGDDSHKQFRPGTRSIKLVMLPNYRAKGEPVMLIRNVRFSELVAIAP